MRTRLSTYKKGTNQYSHKNKGLKPGCYNLIICIELAATILLATLWIGRYEELKRHKPLLVSPLSAIGQVYAQEEAGSSAEIKTDDQKEIARYIREVFKDDAPKAFKLLGCENGKLNPTVVNVNTDETRSHDVGIFQVNVKWQQISERFLKNYKINIQAAHQIYIESGNTFKMWSCGKKLGI